MAKDSIGTRDHVSAGLTREPSQVRMCPRCNTRMTKNGETETVVGWKCPECGHTLTDILGGN